MRATDRGERVEPRHQPRPLGAVVGEHGDGLVDVVGRLADRADDEPHGVAQHVGREPLHAARERCGEEHRLAVGPHLRDRQSTLVCMYCVTCVRHRRHRQEKSSVGLGGGRAVRIPGICVRRRRHHRRPSSSPSKEADEAEDTERRRAGSPRYKKILYPNRLDRPGRRASASGTRSPSRTCDPPRRARPPSRAAGSSRPSG